MKNLWQQPIVVAAYRAIIWAVILAGGAYFGALAQGVSPRAALIPAGVAFFGTLALRGGVEGIVDQSRATPPAT